MFRPSKKAKLDPGNVWIGGLPLRISASSTTDTTSTSGTTSSSLGHPLIEGGHPELGWPPIKIGKKNIYIYIHTYIHQTIIKGQPLKQKQTTNHEFLKIFHPAFFSFALWSANFFVSTIFWMVFYAYFQGEMIRFDWSFSNGFCKWLFGFLKIWIFRIFSRVNHVYC